MKDAIRVLNNPFWINGLEAGKVHQRLHDDHDGTHAGTLNVLIGPDGDCHTWNDGQPGQSLRFRVPVLGGGMSPRVRNALMMLAFAIKLDNEDYPQRSEDLE
ncbi:MAG: hypothetical protein A2568_02445 [Candidatus Yanofskybacteria bacterium RIFOXYD1_FULL_44_17]|nr:MAG: hypothetical protein A2241_02450 [Candidatus Yanofskybacteria bacterium RIFOXYA2_FULL_45_28]OGN35760.1 MAG: hypothetical protein A2207_01665 [Candidatus Yanofskybacteria bacterium RIFOXYA1_FULL_44_17]OGN37056.1 MAG: hypothetical protein A2302_02760 [Candidatus Yanofskybacteria bacterium RIFOXYB2_FULL_44_18]OGN39299.1 MAG: hypothetical protein A2457_00080 [Candidatus Yanofskybacteria bacterium RIFOXYC2_FULL_44_13]OGN39795.1 MAG: hypothetical protein A2568_02445 [Candidatus Yanofskybacter